MVTPATRRAAVSFFRERYGQSERSACRLASLGRSTYRHNSLRREADKPLRERLLELAAERPRFGSRRLHVMLLREGWQINGEPNLLVGSSWKRNTRSEVTSWYVVKEFELFQAASAAVLNTLPLRQLLKWLETD